MKKIILITLLALLTLSCKNKIRNTAARSEAAVESQFIDNDKPDYTGTYKGTLPCADCDGIEVTLKIKDKNEFNLKTRHIAGKEMTKDIHMELDGWYTWNPAESIITLHDITTQPNKYLWSEGMLTQLDINGSRIQGPLAGRYILKK